MTKHTHTPADPSIIQGNRGVPDSATCAGCGKTIEARFGEPWRIVRQATQTYRVDRSHHSDILDQIHGTATDVQIATVRLDCLVDVARREGATWEDIARELGVTRSAAWQRFAVKS